MARRVTIGVTGPDRGGLIAWLMTALAVRRCGAAALRVRPSKPVDKARLDALVIGGGTDVDPLHYGEEGSLEDCPDTRHSSLLDWLVGLVLGAFRAVFARHSPRATTRSAIPWSRTWCATRWPRGCRCWASAAARN